MPIVLYKPKGWKHTTQGKVKMKVRVNGNNILKSQHHCLWMREEHGMDHLLGNVYEVECKNEYKHVMGYTIVDGDGLDQLVWWVAEDWCDIVELDPIPDTVVYSLYNQ